MMMDKNDYLMFVSYPSEFLLDIPKPKEADRLLCGIIIGKRPFVVIFNYDGTGKFKYRRSKIYFESNEALENITDLKLRKRYGFRIEVKEGVVYFNGEEMRAFVDKHRLEKIVEEKV